MKLRRVIATHEAALLIDLQVSWCRKRFSLCFSRLQKILSAFYVLEPVCTGDSLVCSVKWDSVEFCQRLRDRIQCSSPISIATLVPTVSQRSGLLACLNRAGAWKHPFCLGLLQLHSTSDVPSDLIGIQIILDQNLELLHWAAPCLQFIGCQFSCVNL